ncbi:MAG: DUF4139 domain-containing protein [Cyclobacteriaceae bacterium]|nr:DUF4139 domain-containing protein [Cyclobacteriaceae bacterium]UYN86384.1 MAG: DUF4139 domain-containing protein [Cyclobacteriaceae bacterium]
MKRTIFIYLLVAMFPAFSQSEKQVDSKISRVTVFLNRAQVTREVKTRVEAGRTNLIVSGLTSQLDQESVQVSGKGNIVILGINHNQNYLSEFNMPKKLVTLRDSLEIYKRQLAQEQNQKDILTKEEQMILSNQKIGGANQNVSVNELKAMADFYRTRLGEIGLSKMKADDKIKKINERMTRLNQQIREQNELYSRNTSEIVISVSADAATSVELEVNYVVGNAGWYPVYDLRAINTKAPVQLSYKANVFQSTGEEWSNVRLKLSTANPSLGGVKPELYSWYLDFYQPPYVGLKGKAAGVQVQRSVDKREDMPAEELSMAMPSVSNVADFTQTIQTSLNTEFDISLPYTVSSAAKPTLVDIQKHDMKAVYQYAVAPKLDADAFLLAKAVGWEDFNLLPGEANVFFEGTFVGKTFIDPNNLKDTLSVSLGRDKRIVVKREKVKDFTTRRTIASNLREAYAWEISVRNTRNEPVKITVEDHLPLSRNSQIEVTVLDVGGAKHNKDTGKLLWDMNLQPNETRKVVFKYEVKYPKDRQISGL